MRKRGRSRLFHAIVVAGAGLGGGCSASHPIVVDGAADGASADSALADAGTDAGPTTDADDAPGIVLTFPDAGAPDGLQCACPKPPDAAPGACFPCFI
jgi:hypothetical protein